ncbi:hypothetical protein C0995_009654 [Termitomyces sp. Mi166|nr:hypothetical protein C0995_009654 [Termitomyces sp. Mi166\
MFEAGDAQLTASFSLKSRSAPTIKEVVDEDCLKPPTLNSSISLSWWTLGKEKVSANPISSHATPSEQLPQPRDDTAQPQNNAIPFLTSSATFPKPNIAFPKPPPELPNNLDIRIISTASFAWIIWEGAQAYQLHISPSLSKEHLRTNANVPAPKTKLEDQILHKVVPSEYHEYATGKGFI